MAEDKCQVIVHTPVFYIYHIMIELLIKFYKSLHWYEQMNYLHTCQCWMLYPEASHS